MKTDRGTDRRQRAATFVALGAVSGAGLVFEIALTRIFSLFFQYHYAFLAVSLAVLGLSLGASAGYFWRKPTARTLAGVLTALGAVFPAAALGLSWYPSAGSVLPRTLIALVPFILIGLFAALAFERYAAFSGLLYGADLIGAALGVVVVLVLLSLMSAFSLTLGLGVLVCGMALAVLVSDPAARRARGLLGTAAVIGVIGIALFGANLVTGFANFHPSRLKDVPRDKTMLVILDDPTQDARILDTAWSPFARVDVVETNDPSARYVFTDGGAGSYMLRYDGVLDSLRAWQTTIDYVPFTAGTVDQTLVIGSGGGKDIALALLAGAQHVTAVEVNPAVIDVTRAEADYNGGILDLPQVKLVEGDARTFAERDTAQYDLIYLNLVYTQAAEPGSQALVENYIFTWQAFKTYLERLAPGGRIAIVSHNALEGSRAAVTALRALDALGIPPAQALDHLLLWMYPAEDATLRTSVLVVGKDPLSADLIQTVGSEALQRDMQALYVPGDFERAFQPLRNGMSLDEFISDSGDYDLSPTSDDSPYFFHLDPGLPRPIQSALVTSIFLALGIAMFALLMAGPDTAQDGLLHWMGMLLYMALIGTGFMLVEVPLIQRFQLLLGYPIVALVVVLGTLLFAGGIGSLISQRWLAGRPARRSMVCGLWIAVLAVLYRLLLPGLVDALLAQSLALRSLAVIVLTALLGVPMGMPFPGLMRAAGQLRQRVALLWAVNGAFSVLGSVLAVVISMTWGFSWALLLGAGLYLALAAVARPVLKG